jgi:hypothetical protein
MATIDAGTIMGMTRRLISTVLGVALCLLAVAAGAADFAVTRASTFVQGDLYLLDAELRYQLSDPVREALENGVVLTVELQVEVLRRRSWLWDTTVASVSQRYELQFHPLTGQYVVKNLARATQQSYPRLDSALAALGVVRGLPVLYKGLLQPDEDYTIRVRSHLDIESLPTPLRPVAYISPAWWLDTSWYSWPLRQEPVLPAVR